MVPLGVVPLGILHTLNNMCRGLVTYRQVSLVLERQGDMEVDWLPRTILYSASRGWMTPPVADFRGIVIKISYSYEVKAVTWGYDT